MRKSSILAIMFVISIALSIVSMPRAIRGDKYSNWEYIDLRTIDQVDTSREDLDIIAVLSKYSNGNIQIRVDFVDLLREHGFILSVFIDCQPGGYDHFSQGELSVKDFSWDLLLQYSDSGNTTIVNPPNLVSPIKLRTFLDISQNYLEFTLGNIPHNLISNTSRFLILISSQETKQVVDMTEPAFLIGSPPPPVEVAFVFWNCIEGTTPGNALRSWAGAHSGPISSRHGLLYLLDSSRSWEIPVNICDLSSPDLVSTFEYLGVLGFIEELRGENLLLDLSNCSGNGYANGAYPIMFENDSDFAQSVINQYHSSPDVPILIGGDLSMSGLGSPTTVDGLFLFISRHPWIRVVGNLSLATSRMTKTQIQELPITEESNIPYTTTGIHIPSGMTESQIQKSVFTEILRLPKNDLSEYTAFLYNQVVNSSQPNIILARGSYLGQLGHFIAAAKWAENPEEYNSCDVDIDWDGQSECVLSSVNIFMTLELDGGYLAFAYAINPMGVHQIIGPTTQFDVLRSDPSLLVESRGVIGDPGQIPGAFADSLLNWQSYYGVSNSSMISLYSRENTTQKNFAIQGSTIMVTISKSDDMSSLALPITIDPWLRYESNWSNIYWEQLDFPLWIWGAGRFISIGINSDNSYSYFTFNHTHNALRAPENPDYDYSPGHLLPMTMALVEFQADTFLSIGIVIDP